MSVDAVQQRVFARERRVPDEPPPGDGGRGDRSRAGLVSIF